MEIQHPSTNCPKLFQAVFAIASEVEAPISMTLTSRVTTWRLAEIDALISSKQAILDQGGAK